MDQDRGGDVRATRRKWFGSFPPDLQVATGVGSLLALMVVAVLMGVLLIMGPVGDAADDAERQVRYTTAMEAAALYAKGIANDERGYLMTGRSEFLEEIEERTGLARTAFAEAVEMADETQGPAVKLAHAGFERWLAAVDEEIATFDAGDRSGAMSASLGPVRELRKAYERSIADAQSLGDRGLRTANSSMSAASSRSVAILLTYLVIAIGVGVAITARVVHVVLSPRRVAVTRLRPGGEGADSGA